VPYHSQITLKHVVTSHYLHSHIHRYPLRHDDGRISSQGQQVNAYAHSDDNSIWELIPVDPAYYPDEFELSDQEKTREIRYVKHNSLVRFRHVATDSYLITHDVASPLTTTNMEVTTLTSVDVVPRYNDSIWRIQVVDDDSDSHKVTSKRDQLYITNVIHNVALHTHKEALPEWGFKMQEINGNKKITETKNQWIIANVTHAKIIDGILLLKKMLIKNSTVDPNHYHLLSSFLNFKEK
jgi:dolichyl-phosphate-mannose-protein mannosyltransferase